MKEVILCIMRKNENVQAPFPPTQFPPFQMDCRTVMKDVEATVIWPSINSVARSSAEEESFLHRLVPFATDPRRAYLVHPEALRILRWDNKPIGADRTSRDDGGDQG
jgi:hypothetical protein